MLPVSAQSFEENRWAPCNRIALPQLGGEKRLVIVPGATHLFEEPGALDEVARLARRWFERHLLPTTRHAAEASR
jgi:hypothetical protein